MITYKIEGSYFTIDEKQVFITPQIFKQENPLEARREALNALSHLRDVIVPMDEVTKENLFKKEVKFTLQEVNVGSGKKLKFHQLHYGW